MKDTPTNMNNDHASILHSYFITIINIVSISSIIITNSINNDN
jgi:hypothetical protein